MKTDYIKVGQKYIYNDTDYNTSYQVEVKEIYVDNLFLTTKIRFSGTRVYKNKEKEIHFYVSPSDFMDLFERKELEEI